MLYIRDQYLEWPRKLMESYEQALNQLEEPISINDKRNIIGCGMGGSGFSLYAISPLLKSTPYTVVRSHQLPGFVDGSDLVVAVSYSGETFETVSCVRQALERGASVAGVAGENSTLAGILARKGRVVEVVKDGFPRSSLAQLVGGLAALLFGESVRGEIGRASSLLDSSNALNVAEKLASNIYNDGKPLIPLVVSCGRIGFIAERWVTELAENSKHVALEEVFPEAAHNRIARWTYTRGEYYTIYIDVDTSNLCQLVRRYVESKYSVLGPVETIDLTRISNDSEIAAILYSSMLAGLVSVRLAELLERDPEKIEGIEEYKREVVRRLS